MFSTRKREKGRKLAQPAFPILDDAEALSWQWRVAVEEMGEDAANAQYPALGDGSGRASHASLREQPKHRDAGHGSLVRRAGRGIRGSGDEDRALHVSGMFMSVGLNGMGISSASYLEHALAYDPKLAADGRSRGWRRS